MTPATSNRARPAYVSLGIIAWNEAQELPATLESLFSQSLFAQLRARQQLCDIICVANGCTDQTAAVAAGLFDHHSQRHPDRDGFRCRVEELAQRGKGNAWNQFVHTLSSPEARFLFLMDADIRLNPAETLGNMLTALETDAEAVVAVDHPRKDFALRRRRSLREGLSLAASRMTTASPAQLCGQLYCIRAETARNIYLPKDLAACEDGFIKALVCTDFLEHSTSSKRIRQATDAAHTFEGYTRPGAVVKNQKRQIMGQTMVHILVDQYLQGLPAPARARLAETLQARDQTEPDWLKHLMREHLRRTRYFWRLYPGLLGSRFRRLGRQGGLERLACLPTVLVDAAVTLISSALAHRALVRGCTDYWPRARGPRGGDGSSPDARPTAAQNPGTSAPPPPGGPVSDTYRS